MSLKTIPLLLLVFFLVSNAPAQTPSRAPRARNVTGHYHFHGSQMRNSLDVLQLRGRRIKLHLLALWVSPYNRDNIHNGELQGIIKLNGDTAVYEDQDCKVTIKFLATRAMVTQAQDVGDCYFGANVIATGTYRKLDSRKPKFDF